MEEFHRYTFLHAITVASCIAVIAALVWLGRAWQQRAPKRERRLRVLWVIALILQAASTQIWENLPQRIDVTFSLPLHICDLSIWLAPLALLLRWRWPKTLLYFWGIGLSIWALFMPILQAGPANLRFWLFWAGHTFIVGSALYTTFVLGYRPSMRDVAIAALATVGYALAIVPLNLMLGADYGLMGPRSAAAELGPWPWRVPFLLILELMLFVILWMPWGSARRTR